MIGAGCFGIFLAGAAFFWALVHASAVLEQSINDWSDQVAHGDWPNVPTEITAFHDAGDTRAK